MPRDCASAYALSHWKGKFVAPTMYPVSIALAMSTSISPLFEHGTTASEGMVHHSSEPLTFVRDAILLS
jgi:hypothetical protein